MSAAVERYLALLDAAITAHDGMYFKTVGDAVQAFFETALAGFREFGYAPGSAVALEHLAAEARMRGDHMHAAAAW